MIDDNKYYNKYILAYSVSCYIRMFIIILKGRASTIFQFESSLSSSTQVLSQAE